MPVHIVVWCIAPAEKQIDTICYVSFTVDRYESNEVCYKKILNLKSVHAQDMQMWFL